jgi:hypothetical protein
MLGWRPEIPNAVVAVQRRKTSIEASCNLRADNRLPESKGAFQRGVCAQRLAAGSGVSIPDQLTNA